MEEVDNIIIESLRNINCILDEEITSLKSFTEYHIVVAITSCLNAIIPNITIPKHLPTSLSTRLKHASFLVDHIKSLGFKGDLGYQSILYANEIEIRRVLMFLIERLPKESHKAVVTETIGYLPHLIKSIEKQVKIGLKQTWIPSNLKQVKHKTPEEFLIEPSYGQSSELKAIKLQTPVSKSATEDLKNYWIHNLPPVSQQCNSFQLVPSLLFNGNDIDIKDKLLKEFIHKKSNQSCMNPLDLNIPSLKQSVISTMPDESIQLQENQLQTQMETIYNKIETQKALYTQLKEFIKKYENELSQLQLLKSNKSILLNDTLTNYKIKSKTLCVLTNVENLQKLKSMVENGNERLVDLSKQWHAVQTPLLDQYRTLQTSVSEQELKLNLDKDKLSTLKNKLSSLDKEYYAKDILEKSIFEDVSKSNKNTNRTAYTKRILEIIANVKKQDIEIMKILNDTKAVQKEIKNLTGQLERSFAISDALIFKDAKFDEVSRRSYKHLAMLHLDCESLVQAVSEVGLVQRECRNIEEQIEAEANRDLETKLKRVLYDIDQLKKDDN